MQKLSILVVLFISFSAFSQEDTSKSEMNTYQDEVKQTIEEFFDGFHSGDTIKMKNTMDHNMVLLTITKTKSGGKKAITTDVQKFVTAIGSRPAEQKWNEKLLDFTIVANEGIAQAWTPYEFYVNDNFSHCGVNTFQLYNDGESWKIISIADTRKREGCK
ncbi:nuclear transport factor 2 family protein [Aquimarina sp. MMG016]|nr:nuclear transport factor 2 family protein [Aquimarina sp. MMG016]